MDFPMYVYKPRRAMKRGDDSKVNSNRLSHISRHLLIGIAQPGPHRRSLFLAPGDLQVATPSDRKEAT